MWWPSRRSQRIAVSAYAPSSSLIGGSPSSAGRGRTPGVLT